LLQDFNIASAFVEQLPQVEHQQILCGSMNKKYGLFQPIHPNTCGPLSGMVLVDLVSVDDVD
jgi:hypothetical protein